MKKYFSTIFAYICFILLLGCLFADVTSGVSAETLYTRVLRLHVLADSDSQKDQQLKLLVRDGVLLVTEELFYDCKNVEQALEVAKENIHVLEDAAVSVLSANGCRDDVSVVVGVEKYPRKTYGSLTFPAGEYLSVRVIIGSGKGKNWWCVLFPPLCNAGVEEGEKVLSCYGIDKEEIEKLKKEVDSNSTELFGCRIKFRILEFFD